MNSLTKPHAKTVALVEYWPDIENAETECILRIGQAFQDLDVECISINRHGFLVKDPNTHVDEMSVEFVIALHFDSAKCWSAFTYYALWNPLDFYFQWNYREKTRNILSNDAFLSCGSEVADDHIKRLLNGANRSVKNEFSTLYHGTHKPILEPSLGIGKLFYCGINWEAISGKGGRHHELLKLLDEKGLVNIFGPEIFQEVKVWDGYESYQGSIPFDGTSLIKKVAQSGIGLVLSSEAHIQSGLMSSRLFECLAAGVPIICDGNPFAKRNFSDLLLYIDTTNSAHEVVNQISDHIDWIKNHPDEALSMAQKAQAIYLEKFELSKNLTAILKSGEHKNQQFSTTPALNLMSFLVADECDHVYLRKVKDHLKSFANLTNANLTLVLPDTTARARVKELEELSEKSIQLVFYKQYSSNRSKNATNIVEKIINCCTELCPEMLIQIVQPYEFPAWSTIYEQWRLLEDNSNIDMAWAGFTVKTNTAKPNQGQATFVADVILTNLFDANYSFPAASCVFRNEFMMSVKSTLKYTPFFAFRLLYVYALSTNHLKKLAKVSTIMDFDMYSTKFRVDDNNSVFREVEFFTDFLGESFVKANLSQRESTDTLNIDTSSFINSISAIDKKTARILIEKLYNALNLPRFVKKIISLGWSKNVR